MSLRDQLLKAGLVNQKQVKQAEKQRQKQPRRAPPSDAAQKLAAEQAQAAKVARDQELNRRNAAKAERKARVAQVRQLVEQNRLPANDSKSYYFFRDGAHVRRIAVDTLQRAQLSRDELAIARYGKSFALVPLAAAARIRERDPGAIVDCVSAPSTAADAPKDDDDPYKDFAVPDDLIW